MSECMESKFKVGDKVRFTHKVLSLPSYREFDYTQAVEVVKVEGTPYSDQPDCYFYNYEVRLPNGKKACTYEDNLKGV